jgi:hypothetical protein
MSNEWYRDHVKETSPAFEAWWREFYGSPGDYAHDVDEYYVRKAFAWHGWNAHVKAIEKSAAEAVKKFQDDNGIPRPKPSG